ncbi:hypothetical protein EV363DRAFT_1465462 [Boletus edulis]|nr:hypothetical protein EV363DRAFT_1465462 [Boletus edulis]
MMRDDIQPQISRLSLTNEQDQEGTEPAVSSTSRKGMSAERLRPPTCPHHMKHANALSHAVAPPLSPQTQLYGDVCRIPLLPSSPEFRGETSRTRAGIYEVLGHDHGRTSEKWDQLTDKRTTEIWAGNLETDTARQSSRSLKPRVDPHQPWLQLSRETNILKYREGVDIFDTVLFNGAFQKGFEMGRSFPIQVGAGVTLIHGEEEYARERRR